MTVLRRTLAGAVAVAAWVIFPLFGIAHADTPTAASQLAFVYSNGCFVDPFVSSAWQGGAGCSDLPAFPSADAPGGGDYHLEGINSTSAGWVCRAPDIDADTPGTCSGDPVGTLAPTAPVYTSANASWLVPDVPSAGDYGADAVAPAVLEWISAHGAPFVAGLLFVGIAFALLIRNARRGARAA